MKAKKAVKGSRTLSLCETLKAIGMGCQITTTTVSDVAVIRYPKRKTCIIAYNPISIEPNTDDGYLPDKAELDQQKITVLSVPPCYRTKKPGRQTYLINEEDLSTVLEHGFRKIQIKAINRIYDFRTNTCV